MKRPRDKRYDTARWRRLRARIVARDDGRCTMEGCTTNTSRPRSLHVDHIVEVSDGGDFWSPSNLRTLCWLHHGAKTRLEMANRAGGDAPRDSPVRICEECGLPTAASCCWPCVSQDGMGPILDEAQARR